MHNRAFDRLAHVGTASSQMLEGLEVSIQKEFMKKNAYILEN